MHHVSLTFITPNQFIFMKNALIANKSNLSAAAIFAAAFVLTLSFGAGQAEAAIVNQLELGSRGAQVTELQQFLALNTKVYPAGLVTGFFGPMTQAAVVQFQANYDISQVGRVGPATMARINAVMNAGQGLDIDGPSITNLAVQTNSFSTTLSWNSDSNIRGKIFYSTQPLQVQEASSSFMPPVVGGLSVESAAVGTSQSLSLTNLSSNTVYYYLVQATDLSGNVSVTRQSTFQTK